MVYNQVKTYNITIEQKDNVDKAIMDKCQQCDKIFAEYIDSIKYAKLDGTVLTSKISSN